jgi:hypothetical protein
VSNKWVFLVQEWAQRGSFFVDKVLKPQDSNEKENTREKVGVIYYVLYIHVPVLYCTVKINPAI